MLKLRTTIAALHAAALCLLLAVSPAGSGSMTLMGAGKVAAGGAAYTGVGDIASIPTPVLAWGAHCFKSSYVGNILDVYETASSSVKATLTCSSGGVIGATGTWSLAQVQSNCNALGNCYAIKLYDQSGALACSGGTACDSGTMITTTAPSLVYADGSTTCGTGSSFINVGRFCLQTNIPSGTVTIVSAALGSTIAQPISIVVTYADAIAAQQGSIIYESGGNTNLAVDCGAVASLLCSYGGSAVVSTASSDLHWHTGLVTLNGASSYLQVDNGSVVTTSPGTSSILSGATLGMANNGTPFYSWLGDVYVFKTTTINAAAAGVYANEKAFWGGGMP